VVGENKVYSFNGINEALVVMSKEVLEKGVFRKTPGFQAENSNRCLELPFPIIIEMNHPEARKVKIPERKWNSTLPYAESLWLALGWNSLDDLPGKYVKSLYNFSDDGHYWRAGYGPRIRHYNGLTEQYSIGVFGNFYDWVPEVDQLKYVYETLKKDPNSRQALITIHDPMKDSKIDLVTKDQPCTRSLHFMVVEDKLNLYTTMRSNDLLWGFSAVNNFNFTFMLEYMSKLLNIPMGKYYHIAHNFHIYEDFIEKVRKISEFSIEEAIEMDSRQFKEVVPFKEGYTLKDFDKDIIKVFTTQDMFFIRPESIEKRYQSFLDEGRDKFFNDWLTVFYKYHIRKRNKNEQKSN
jgi:thymidylate synthase